VIGGSTHLKKQDTKKMEEKKKNENTFGPFPNLFQKNGCLHWAAK
jgi:hypothetical protein